MPIKFNKESGSCVCIEEQKLWDAYFDAIGKVIDAPTDTNVNRLKAICETDAYKALCQHLESGVSLQHI